MWRLVSDPEAVTGIGYIIVVSTGTLWLLALLGWITEGGLRRLIRRIKKRMPRKRKEGKMSL